MSSATQSLEDFESLLLALQQSLGVVVPDEQRASLIERVEPLLSVYQLDSLAELATCIHDNKLDSIRSKILDALSHSQSHWSLGVENEQLLNDYIFPQIPSGGCIWIAGCGTGQLAYYVAMALAVYEHISCTEKNIKILATDISQENVKHAQSSRYSKTEMKGLREDYKKLFFTIDAKDGSGRLKEKIHQRVRFSRCDLNDDETNDQSCDLIICTEELVYYSNEKKANILQRLSASLKTGGILLPENNQSLMSPIAGMERVEHPAGIFYRQTG